MMNPIPGLREEIRSGKRPFHVRLCALQGLPPVGCMGRKRADQADSICRKVSPEHSAQCGTSSPTAPDECGDSPNVGLSLPMAY